MRIPPPTEIYQRLEELGYRGQEEARQAVCLVAYRHVKRLYHISSGKIARELLPPRPNSILIGPTGCGKTHLIELLFGKILNLPYVIVEMTRFSETGYIGDNVLNILTRLMEAAGGKRELAETGVVAMDEFDKLASSGSNIRFAGQGTTKDVSGYGVQRELLKMLDGSDVQFSLDYGFSSKGEQQMMSTRDVTFFGLGTFSGFKSLDSAEPSVGFSAHKSGLESKGRRTDGIAYRVNQQEADDIGRFQTCGFIPELIGRFTRIIPFQPLDTVTLRSILMRKVEEHKREFQEEGFDLRFDASVRDMIVQEAFDRQTGARGLESAIVKSLETFGFKHFGQGTTGGVVTMREKDGQIVSEVRLQEHAQCVANNAGVV